jgi:hypothetical protein
MECRIIPVPHRQQAIPFPGFCVIGCTRFDRALPLPVGNTCLFW